MRHQALEHRFIKHIPDILEAGILYVSLEYGTVAHSCCCGCGEEVITPLTPTDWKLIFDGETISLHPSVGNWSLPCRSHYVIKRGQICVAAPWSERQIEAERQRDHLAKAKHFNQAHTPDEVKTRDVPEPATENLGWFRNIWFKIFNG